jgi:hypothetical protein
MVLATTRQNCNKMQKHNKKVAVMSIMVPKENKFGREEKNHSPPLLTPTS